MSVETDSHLDIDIGSERSFGFVFAIVFGIVGLWPLLFGNGVRWWAILIALAFALVALVKPDLLEVPNRWWFRLAILLGAIVAPIVMGLVYFIAVVPTGLVVRAMGKTLLPQGFSDSEPSYWIKRETPEGSMKDQF